MWLTDKMLENCISTRNLWYSKFQFELCHLLILCLKKESRIQKSESSLIWSNTWESNLGKPRWLSYPHINLAILICEPWFLQSPLVNWKGNEISAIVLWKLIFNVFDMLLLVSFAACNVLFISLSFLQYFHTFIYILYIYFHIYT